jgi:hypothetical protein
MHVQGLGLNSMFPEMIFGTAVIETCLPHVLTESRKFGFDVDASDRRDNKVTHCAMGRAIEEVWRAPLTSSPSSTGRDSCVSKCDSDEHRLVDRSTTSL